MKKGELTPEKLEELNLFVRQQQQFLCGALVMEMLHFGVPAITLHTEASNKEISDVKYLVTTIVRPLTDELKKELDIKPKENGK